MPLAPMMQHYVGIKEKYKDCVVFYRLGDFYEMFFDDAVRVSAMLDLTLTGRDCGLAERAPMCGVPYHAADTYISKLVALGEKVAICEQLTEPTSKGIVERDVIRVVTAGTLIDENQLDEKRNNYVACACQTGARCALAWADITTGEFCVCDFEGKRCESDAIEKLIKIAPSEVICNDEFLFSTKDNSNVKHSVLPKFSCYVPWAFNLGGAKQKLLGQFKTNSLSAYGIEDKSICICAAGALVEYLFETQKRSLANLDGIKYVSEGVHMMLDASAIKNLELMRTLGEGKKYGSLLWLCDKTKTNMGARLLSNMLLSPLNNADAINYRLDGVQELYSAPVVMLSIADVLVGLNDVERLSGKISNDNITPRDCIALAKSLLLLPAIKMQIGGFSSQIMHDIFDSLVDMTKLANMIKAAIIEEFTPVTAKDGGFVCAGYNAQLDEYRNIKENSKKIIADIEAREREKTGIKTLRIGYNRVFGYYIEVTKSFKDKVPYYFQRRQTLTNAERYTIDELKELEEKILTSEEQSIKLENAIFSDVKLKMSEHIKQFKQISYGLALIDCLVSFASLAKENKYCRPNVLPAGQPLEIVEGRHPVVEAISKERFVPNDCYLNSTDCRTAIITGPNMAGKSTYMRQVALIVLMAHIGSFVPAKSANIPLTDKVFTRVGASDNLIFDQSTFMVEMNEVANILQNATADSLLVLDEVGRGTSTFDGLSIAWAVTEYITQNIKAKTLFATHYHELTELEDSLEGVKNYKVMVKELNGSIVFLRKIMRGGANKSFGIEVASLAGIPKDVTLRAKQILKSLEKREIARIKEGDAEIVNEDISYSEVEKILFETDIDKLSPMQAFLVLNDLIEKVKEKK